MSPDANLPARAVVLAEEWVMPAPDSSHGSAPRKLTPHESRHLRLENMVIEDRP
jgi:hypothetical protein